MKESEYIFNRKATINEGITTGRITKAAMYFTKEYIYIIPLDSLGNLGMDFITTEYTNANDFLSIMEQQMEQVSRSKFHDTMKSFLPSERIFPIRNLEKFVINTGWLTAGIKLKTQNSKLKVISIRPRDEIKRIKAFYQL
jgi:hypothetical protein